MNPTPVSVYTQLASARRPGYPGTRAAGLS